MSANDPVHDALFAGRDNEKQERYEARVCTEILRGVDERHAAVLNAFYRAESKKAASAVDGYTPEWLSDYCGWPIVFRAVRDFTMERRDFPSPLWLLDKRIDGRRCRSVWDKLWLETRERYSGAKYVCVCFRPAWAERTLTLHNYEPALTHVYPSPCRGGSMSWMTDLGPVIMQYLPYLLHAARGELHIQNG